MANSGEISTFPRMRGITLLCSMLFIVATIVRCADTPRISAKNQMNVVLITIDTLRADHLRCYGYGSPISRNIDALAARGARFNRCISQSSMTPASHASIFTGQNPYLHGVRTISGGEPYKLADDHFTLATLLKNVGYDTAAFISTAALDKEAYGLDSGFDVYEQSFSEEKSEDEGLEGRRVSPAIRQNSTQRRADATTSLAVEWLGDAGEKPFFLWVHYFDPHETFLVPPMIPGVFTYTYEKPLTDIHPQMYDIEISFVDLMIDNLIDELVRSSLLQNTLIVLTSDHGQGLGDHNYGYHGQKLYQEQIHVPLIFVGEPIPRGLKLDALVRSIDITPTILDYLGYPERHIPGEIEGISLRGLIEGRVEEKSAPTIAYSETSSPKVRYQRSPLFSLIESDDKLIYHSEEPEKSELYDLARDPLETENLFHQRPARSRELIEKIEQLQEKTTVDLDHIVVDQDKSRRDKLKALGYL